MTLKIIHLVPYDGIGGVESAARSMGNFNNETIDFQVEFIFRAGIEAVQRRATFNPLGLLAASRRITDRCVDVVILSLWRSAIVGVLAKLLRPKLKLVVFIHLATDVHWMDFIFTRLAIRFAHEVWADSHASLRERFPKLAPGKCRVISFVTSQFEALPKRDVNPDFIFWGRINAQKGIDRAIRIFADIHAQCPSARFFIIGPDGGVLCSIQQLCKSLGVSDKVLFLGAATSTQIVEYARKASFYLQTSLFEGMAMSVVEAMQMGLVPIVTPVGEIASYCAHGVNALIVDSDRQAAEDAMNLLADNENYQLIRLNAIAAWKNKPLYAESVVHACEALMTGDRRIY